MAGASASLSTTPLCALWPHRSYFHDGSAPNLGAVVEHYNKLFDLKLNKAQKADLVEYLNSLYRFLTWAGFALLNLEPPRRVAAKRSVGRTPDCVPARAGVTFAVKAEGVRGERCNERCKGRPPRVDA